MDKLLTLIEKCKNSVTLTVNEYRDFYQSIEEYAAEQNSRHSEWDDDEDVEIDNDTMLEMIKADHVVNLHFYPRTSNGFYSIWGSNIEEVLDLALSTIESDNNVTEGEVT